VIRSTRVLDCWYLPRWRSDCYFRNINISFDPTTCEKARENQRLETVTAFYSVFIRLFVKLFTRIFIDDGFTWSATSWRTFMCSFYLGCYDNTEPLYFHRTHLISPLSWYTVAYRRIRSELAQSSGLSSASSTLRPGDTDWPPKSWLGTQIVARPPNLAVLLTHCGHYNTLWSIDSQENH